MNVLFLTLDYISNTEGRGIYTDLIRKFRKEGHEVYVVTPGERRLKIKTCVTESKGCHILTVKTLNIQKTNVIEKGIGILLLEKQYKTAIKKYYKGIKFDLITYSTPPVTYTNILKYLKQKNPTAITYLQLKDIFPQNAVDIEMLSTKGLRWLLYRYFRNKETKLYAYSDYIGCMSPANVEYVLKHNPEIAYEIVGVAPNSVELRFESVESVNSLKIREKYGLPIDKPIFIFGGNLGKPQGISFLIDCLNANAGRRDCHFLVIGTGTELPRLKAWYKKNKPQSVTVMNGLPQADYDQLVKSCDVGLIFLDHRFTIPNYPSRLLSYLENKMPVLCATDPNTDMGRIAEDNGYGFWCESNSVEAFTAILDKMIHSDRKVMGEKGYEFLKNNYLVEHTYNAIVKHLV